MTVETAQSGTDLGKLGVWSFIDTMSSREAVQFVRQLESWGYGTLWVPEAVGRDPFSIISFLAAHTEKLVFATGIANIYARDAMAMNAIRNTVAELAPGRFVLGLGVSHAPLVSDMRGHDYKKPVTTMRHYLEGMQQSLYLGAAPEQPAPVLLGALRPKMLALSAELANGAHPYFAPVEHTRQAREVLGSEALLCPEQMVLLETDADKARTIARKQMETYVGLENYRNNLRQFGFDDEDFENNGSDRLVDAIFAWGDLDAIKGRLKQQWDAGANHVCIQTYQSDGEMGPNMELLEMLAPDA